MVGSPKEQEDILVLGIGNLLWADEGFGVRCVERLAALWSFPPNVTVMDGGTQGLYLLPYVTAADRMILFDAIDYGLDPGTLHCVEDDDVPRFTGAKKMSLHQSGFQEVLAAAALLDKLPRSILLIGVQPVDMMDYGGSLKDPLKDRLTEALALALDRLRVWGVEPVAEQDSGPVILNDASLALDLFEAGRPPPDVACRTGDARVLPRRALGDR